MLPLPFVYPYWIAFWALYLVVFVPEFLLIRRARAQPRTAQDRGSLRLIFIGNTVGTAIAFFCAFRVRGATIVAERADVFAAGVLLIAAGGLLRQHCFRTLGTSFKAVVLVRSDQPIVERGAYRFVRHPSYAGAMLLFAGIGLALTNWLSVLVLLTMLAVVYGYRMHVEEAALVATLGDSYRAYQARTKRIVPFIW